MKALVTGGGGFLGRWIAEKLQARGDEVRIFARGAYPDLVAAGMEVVRGDLQNAQDTAAACEGMDVVFHVAALAGLWGSKEVYWGPNVDGSRNVLEGCRKHGVPKLVYTSSPSVIFGMDDLCGVDNTYPYPKRFYANYPASKAAAEKELLAAADDKVAICALRPHLIWGPRDTHIIPLIAERAKAGKLIQIGDGSNLVDLTYVENAADGHLQAADALTPDSPLNGTAYFLSDPKPVNLWGWVGDFLEQADLPPVKKTLSFGTAKKLGFVMECAWNVLPLPGEPLLTRFVAAQFATSHYFDWTASTRDFGYDPAVDNAEGMRRTMHWYQRQRAEAQVSPRTTP